MALEIDSLYEQLSFVTRELQKCTLERDDAIEVRDQFRGKFEVKTENDVVSNITLRNVESTFKSY